MGTERIIVAAVAGIALGLSVFAAFRPLPDVASASMAQAGPVQGATAPDDDAFGAKVKAYLMKHPEVIFEAADAHQKRETEKAQAKLQATFDKNKDELAKLPGHFYGGNPNAKITIVEFFDYHCGFCKAAMPKLVKLLDKNKDVRLRLMEFPILSPESVVASRASIASNEQGKYFAFHQAMMSARGMLTKDRIFAIAKKVGLDVDKLKKDMDSDKTEKILDAHRSFAEKVGFEGTPGLIVGGHVIPGWDEAAVKNYVAEQRKKNG